MAVTQTLSEGLKREFEVVITNKEINNLVEVKLNDLAKEANLPGFRPGKVPVSVVKNRFGKQVLGEVVRESVDNATKETIENNKLVPSSQPKIEITSFEEGEDLKAKLSVELMPEFEIPDLSKLEISKPVVKVGEKEVDEAVEKIATENVGTKTVTAKRPAKLGDTVVIDFLGKIDDVPFEGGEAKGHNLKLGSNSFIPGFEDGLVGCSKGKKVEIKVTFPKDYQAANLAGKDAVFETTINEIKEDNDLVINDDLAKNLGMENLASLKKAVSEQISKQHELASRDKSKRQVLDKLADSISFELPETLEKEEYNSICMAMNPNAKPDNIDKSDDKPELQADKGMSDEEKADASEIAKRRVRLGLLLSEIGRKNNIKVEEEDTRNAMMKEIQKYPGQEKQVMDYFKNNPEAQQQLSGPIFEDKIIDFILELANVKEKTVSVEELYKTDDLDLKKEAAKAKKSNKSLQKDKPKKTVKKNKVKS
ncbi:MAG: trigger factor [Alphaproteobacteria bacterium]|jgi:trigger factor|nr:trigger factor [Alphaproteobacteria bacterium]MDB2583292.1 trigger factor [Alphaproteobacteria bacterium]